MVTVYALRNHVNNEIYVGITTDPNRRLREHNSGKNRYTKAFMPWETFYVEHEIDFERARVREKYLKTASGKRYLRDILSKL